MLCPNCKKENPDGTQFCANCGVNFNAPVQQPVKQKKPITKKWWFWVIIVVVVIGLISAISGGGDDETTSTGGETVSQNADAGTTKAPETTTVGENYYHVGDTLKAGGLKITFVSAEEWYDYDQYYGPTDGNKIIRIKIDVTNEGSSDAYLSAYDFSCYADNKPAEEYIWADDDYSGDTLSSGRNDSGYLYYEIPVNAESIELEYETDYWTDKKAIIVIDL